MRFSTFVVTSTAFAATAVMALPVGSASSASLMARGAPRRQDDRNRDNNVAALDVPGVLAAMNDAEADLARQLQTLEEEKATADEEKTQLEAELEAEDDPAQQLNIQGQIQANDDKVAKLDTSINEFQRVVQTFNTVKTDLEANENDEAAAAAAIADELQDLAAQEQRVADALNEVDQQKAQLAQQKADLEEQIDALDAVADAEEIAQLQVQVTIADGLDANLDELQEDLDQTQGVIDLIQQLLEDAQNVDDLNAADDVEQLIDDINETVTDIQDALRAVTTTLADNRVNSNDLTVLLGLVQRTVNTANLLDTTIQGGVAGIQVV